MSRRIDRYQNRQIRNIKKDLRQMKMDEEVKYHELYLATQTPALAGTLNILNAIPETTAGNGKISREGAEVRCTSLRFRLEYYSLTAATTAVIFRLIIFWDLQTNGAAPPVSGNALTGTTALLNNRVTTDLVFSMKQLENAERFDIVHDKVYTINPQTTSPGAVTPTITTPYSFSKTIIKTFKFNRMVQFDAPAGLTTSINRNALWCLILPQVVNVGEFDLSTVVYFKD